jgi:hypothetical protein
MATTTRNPSLILSMGQPEWEVEAILGARRKQNQLQYLVRWKGFSEAHDSWCHGLVRRPLLIGDDYKCKV